MNLLIVEDDPALGVFLQKGIKLEGHEVTLVVDGQSGLDHVRRQPPDLMILDLNLPHKNGMQVLEEMQGHSSDISILILTGRIGLQDRLTCLNLGADDFLMKPFSFSELAARCRALLRRRRRFADPILRGAGIELDRISRSVKRDGRVIDLTIKEFALLEYLMQAGERVCSRGELMREVWPMSPNFETNVVDVYVNYLRKKLGNRIIGANGRDNPVCDSNYPIRTVRGEGYGLAVSLQKFPPSRSVPDSVTTKFPDPHFLKGAELTWDTSDYGVLTSA